MTGRVVQTDIECSCGRTVTEVNYHAELHTCTFCDLNETGEPDNEN